MQEDTSYGERLNPFAFPPETNTRFTLFLIASLLISFSLVSYVLPELLWRFFPNLESSPVLNAFQVATQLTETDTQNMEEVMANLNAGGAILKSLAPGLGWVVLTIFLAFILYMYHPTHIRRRKNFHPINQVNDLILLNEIDDLNKQTGISPIPSVELGKELRLQNGQAYGIFGKYVIGLDGGFRLLVRKSPQTFRTIVLHEMGHIANRDIGRTYFTQSLWTSVIITLFIPISILTMGLFFYDYVVMSLLEGTASIDWNRALTIRGPALLRFLLQFGVAIWFVAAVRANLLRVREIYADWWASLWTTDTSLLDLLKSKTMDRPREKWRILPRLHPVIQERILALKDPGKLFKTTPDLPFLVGFLLAFVLEGGVFIAGSISISALSFDLAVSGFLMEAAKVGQSTILARMALFTARLGPIILLGSFSILFFLLAYIIAGTLGIQIWRETMADMVVHRLGTARYLHLFSLAIFMSLGMEAGFLFAPASSFWPDNVLQFLRILVWLAVVTILTWLCFCYARYFGQRILGAHFSKSSPMWKRRFLTLLLTILMTGFLLALIVWRYFYVHTYDPESEQSLRFFISRALLIMLFIYSLAFIATYLVDRLIRIIRSVHCPFCGRKIRQTQAVGQVCEHCNRMLAPWLYVASSSR